MLKNRAHKLVVHLADGFIDLLERKLASFIVTGDVAQEIELPRVIFKHDLGDGEADVLIGRKR